MDVFDFAVKVITYLAMGGAVVIVLRSVLEPLKHFFKTDEEDKKGD